MFRGVKSWLSATIPRLASRASPKVGVGAGDEWDVGHFLAFDDFTHLRGGGIDVQGGTEDLDFLSGLSDLKGGVDGQRVVDVEDQERHELVRGVDQRPVTVVVERIALAGLVERRQRAGGSAVPGSRTSSPVESSATRKRRNTGSSQ